MDQEGDVFVQTFDLRRAVDDLRSQVGQRDGFARPGLADQD